MYIPVYNVSTVVFKITVISNDYEGIFSRLCDWLVCKLEDIGFLHSEYKDIRDPTFLPCK